MDSAAPNETDDRQKFQSIYKTRKPVLTPASGADMADARASLTQGVEQQF
jgi:hypothetical protein